MTVLTPVFEASGLTKAFGDVTALRRLLFSQVAFRLVNVDLPFWRSLYGLRLKKQFLG